MRWLDGITISTDMNLGALWEMVRDREAWHAALHGATKNQTWLSDRTTMTGLFKGKTARELGRNIFHLPPGFRNNLRNPLRGTDV